MQCTRFSVLIDISLQPQRQLMRAKMSTIHFLEPSQIHFYYWDDWITRWNPIKLNRQSQCSIHLLTYEANSIYCLTLSYSLPLIPTILIKLEFEWAFSMFINQNARSRKSKWSGNILNCWLMTAATLEGVKLRRDEAVLETRGFNLPRLRQQDHILSSTWNEAHVMKENVIW